MLEQDRRDSNERMKDPGQNSIDRKGRSRTGKQTEQVGQEKQDRARIIVG